MDVCAIATVGKSGQIGLNGKFPWKHPESMNFFKSQIKGGIVVVGSKTFDSMPDLFDCQVDIWSRTYTRSPDLYINSIQHRYKYWPISPVIWIAGGAEIYRIWAPYVKRLVISTIDYDGAADTYFPWDAYQNYRQNNTTKGGNIVYE